VNFGEQADAAHKVIESKPQQNPPSDCSQECIQVCVFDLHCECGGCVDGVFECTGDCHT
jgi:hypothetical protein